MCRSVLTYTALLEAGVGRRVSVSRTDDQVQNWKIFMSSRSVSVFAMNAGIAVLYYAPIWSV